MEKISSILPANARVTTVDLKNSGVARAGTPSFGREVGLSSVIERNQAELATRANTLQGEQLKQRTSAKLDPRAEIVQKMADNFFMNKARQIEAEKADRPESSNETMIREMREQIAPLTAQSQNMTDADAELSSSEDDVIVGQHLDVMA